MRPALLLVLLLVSLTILPALPVAQGTGYLAIRDYIGRVWTIDDVARIMNYTINGSSLASYLWIIVDGNEKYNLSSFMASPLDNKTAVLPLPAGEHVVDVVWYGYRQRSNVLVEPGAVTVLRIDTAPVVPFSWYDMRGMRSGWAASFYPGDEYSSPGILFSHSSGAARVKLRLGEPVIDVWVRDPYVGEQYYAVRIDTLRDLGWGFGLTSVNSSREYTVEEKNILGWTWSSAVVNESIVAGEILPGVYHAEYAWMIAVAPQDAARAATMYRLLYAAVRVSTPWLINPLAYWVTAKWYMDAVDGLSRYVEANTRVYMIHVGLWLTRTQVLVIASAWRKDPGDTDFKPYTMRSPTAFTYMNFLVWEKQLGGSVWIDYYYQGDVTVTAYSNGNGPVTKYLVIKTGRETGASGGVLTLWGGQSVKIRVDDLSAYDYGLWFRAVAEKSETVSGSGQASVSVSEAVYQFGVEIMDKAAAEGFADKLDQEGIQYTRQNNTFLFTSTGFNTNGETVLIEDYRDVERLMPSCPGTVFYNIYVRITVFASDTSSYTYQYARASITVHDIGLHAWVRPRIEPPSITLQVNAAWHIAKAYGARIYIYAGDELEDSAAYLGYYLLDNSPPPLLLIRDAFLNLSQYLSQHTGGGPKPQIVYSLVTVDLADKDLVTVDVNSSVNETIYVVGRAPGIRLIENTTFALWDLDRFSPVVMSPWLAKLIITQPGQDVVEDIIVLYTGHWLPLNGSEKLWVLLSQGWVRAKVTKVYNDTYRVVTEMDGKELDTLPPNTTSKHVYMVEKNNTNHTGVLANRNGSLVLLEANLLYHYPPGYLDQLAKRLAEQLAEQYKQAWLEAVNQYNIPWPWLPGIGANAAWPGLGNLWLWLVLGGIAFLTFLLLLIYAAKPSSVHVHTV